MSYGLLIMNVLVTELIEQCDEIIELLHNLLTGKG